MRITFLGAVRTTTGSQYLLEVNGKKLLLECGLYQGHRDEARDRNCCFKFNPAEIDAVILSHAHIDHCGNLPNLCKQGFKGSIYCTFATRDLASIMLEDSARIQTSDAAYVSKKRAKQGLPPVQALYSVTEAEVALRQFVALGYDRPISVEDGVKLTFKEAGHILGSAQIVLDINENGRKYRYLFTGDVGRGGDLILRDPVGVENVDYLQIESTYGNRLHEAKSSVEASIVPLVKDTIRQGGKVIIPAFAVGRTQEIVYALNRIIKEEQLPRVPIFVDSPLAVNATEVHRLHPECFNAEVYQFLREVRNPFEMEDLTYIRTVQESKNINEIIGPAIVISASGMAEAGRILHHLKNGIGNPVNLILFVGYCAENTLGAQILSGKSPVNILGEPHAVRARVAKMDALSGHADRHELEAHVRRMTGNIKKAFVVHGEEEQSLAFATLLGTLLPGAEVLVPTLGQSVEI